MSPVKNITFNTKLSIKNVSYCLAENLYVSNKDSRYKSIKGVIYSKDGKKIIRVPSERKDLKIENGCEEFCLESIFYAGYVKNRLLTACDELVKITIPETVNRISMNEMNNNSRASGFHYTKLKEFVFETKSLDDNSILKFITEMKNVRNSKGKRSVYVSDIAKGLTDRIKLKNDFSSDWLGGMLEFRSDFKNAFTDLDVYNFKWNKKKKRREVYIKWIKVKDVDGYDIRVSSKKNYKKNVKKVDAKKNKTGIKIQVSKRQKRIYVKIRPYKTVNGTKVYGRWTEENR